MECASVMAMAEFRQIDIYQFLYTADNLDTKEWEPRLLGNMSLETTEKFIQIALEVAARI
ncbi:MAG: hypothetical protein FWF22_06820 [Treponema sp.]|nr:hypothetical protein [Treponema sp.]